MAASDEKHDPVTFGVTIEGPTGAAAVPPKPILRSPPSNDSTMTSVAEEAAAKEALVDSANPYSAFYKHPEARRSMDNTLASKTHLEVTTYERNLEAGVPLSTASTQQLPKVSVDGRVKECTMWPSRQAVLDQRKTYERTRGCNLFRNLTNKQRLWCKLVIALFVIAAAVGLGVGISRAVGGGVWAGDGKSKAIPTG